MKRINTLAPILLVCISFTASAKGIETKEEAEAFLDKYCIALVNEIAKAVKRQDELSSKNEWQKVGEQGVYIAGVADVYSKLCVGK